MKFGDISDNYEYSRKYRLVFMKDVSNSCLIEYEAQSWRIAPKVYSFVTNYTHV